MRPMGKKLIIPTLYCGLEVLPEDQVSSRRFFFPKAGGLNVV